MHGDENLSDIRLTIIQVLKSRPCVADCYSHWSVILIGASLSRIWDISIWWHISKWWPSIALSCCNLQQKQTLKGKWALMYWNGCILNLVKLQNKIVSFILLPYLIRLVTFWVVDLYQSLLDTVRSNRSSVESCAFICCLHL